MYEPRINVDSESCHSCFDRSIRKVVDVRFSSPDTIHMGNWNLEDRRT